jgi:hypothetical protein
MKVVISQSMLFPWVGLLEQVRLADVFVHYDDVQFSKGSFVNRVQIKTAGGSRWMTVPTRNLRLGQRIDEVEVADPAQWSPGHLDLLRRSLEGAPHAQDAVALAGGVYAARDALLGPLARRSFRALIDYFGLDRGREFIDVTALGVPGASTQRVLDVVRRVGGTTYITGHGAAQYLDHEAFERAGVGVEYVQYRKTPYPQLHGEFTPYVSALDLVANCGQAGAASICSPSIHWKEFLDESPRRI